MEDKLYADLSSFFKISKEELSSQNITLRDIMEKSEVAVNSVDIMEGFADVLQDNDLDDKVDIPVFTLEDKVQDVINSILVQLQEEEHVL